MPPPGSSLRCLGALISYAAGVQTSGHDAPARGGTLGTVSRPFPDEEGAAELAATLRVAVARLARRLRAEQPDDGPPVSGLAVLCALEEHGSLSPGELAGHEHVRPSSMSRLLAALEADGLVARHHSPTDRRRQVVEITPAGHDLLLADRERREVWLACRLASLAPAQRALLRRAAVVLDELGQS